MACLLLKLCSLQQHIPGVYSLVKRPHIPVRGHLNVLDVSKRFGNGLIWLYGWWSRPPLWCIWSGPMWWSLEFSKVLVRVSLINQGKQKAKCWFCRTSLRPDQMFACDGRFFCDWWVEVWGHLVHIKDNAFPWWKFSMGMKKENGWVQGFQSPNPLRGTTNMKWCEG